MVCQITFAITVTDLKQPVSSLVKSAFPIQEILKKIIGRIEMLVTTTPNIEGKRIIEYKGLVFGEVVSGVDFIKDFAAGLSNFFGGRSRSYEGELIEAREGAVREMVSRAGALGANAVVGVDVDYEVLGQGNMLMVTASGTAVIVE
jgi:uncharacterized protein YbjQ (UPF0145 family)